MNFLAHLLLADDSPASRIGNLLGDFTRGPLENLPQSFPTFSKEVLRGIHMHRVVDGFADRHETFKQSRALLAPERRRFAGIIPDLFQDHFLSIHWSQFSSMPLEQFCQQAYQELENHPEWHAGRLGEILPIMKRENWLMRYGTMEGMRLTLSEVSQRSPRISPMAEGIIDLEQNYSALESNFQLFMPDLLGFVHTWKVEHSPTG